MKFYQRLAYYLVGFVIGLFFVAMVLSGKDTRCNYFPNARVLNDLRNKPFQYDSIASQQMSEGLADKTDIKNLLTPSASARFQIKEYKINNPNDKTPLRNFILEEWKKNWRF